MRKYKIEKFNQSLKWELVSTHNRAESAFARLKIMANTQGWRFIPDQSLFGGFYSAKNGDCYRVS